MNRLIAAPIALACLAAAPAAASAASPSVATAPASSISNTKATLNATINPGGQRTTYAFQYGGTSAYGVQTTVHSLAAGQAAVKVKAALSGLTSGTVYHFRILAGNASGSVVGADRTFKTTGSPPPPPPAVLTGAANTTRHGATLTGLINPLGRATSYYFQFGLTGFYGLQTAVLALPASNAIIPVSFPVAGLATHRLYHYRLVATSRSGTAAGVDQVFTTGRFAAGLTRNTRSRGSHVLTSSGLLQLPGGFPPAQACQGVVRIRFQTARRTLANVRVAVNTLCRYTARVTIRGSFRGRLRVRARFLGNALLTPHSARSQTVSV